MTVGASCPPAPRGATGWCWVCSPIGNTGVALICVFLEQTIALPREENVGLIKSTCPLLHRLLLVSLWATVFWSWGAASPVVNLPCAPVSNPGLERELKLEL